MAEEVVEVTPDSPTVPPFRVLVGVDSSENAEYAFDYYMKHLHKAENQLILLHVAEAPSSSMTFMSGGVWEEVIQRERDRTNMLEKKCKELLEKFGVSGRFLAAFGSKPGETIVDTAGTEKANLIVVGSRGQGKLRRTILGSVSDYVLHHSHCAVVVCRHETHHQHHHQHHHHHHHFGFHLPGFHHHHHHDKEKHHDKEQKQQEKANDGTSKGDK